MCGILGFCEGRAPRKDIDTLASLLAHRGPDARGVFAENNTTLAHLRLSILDLSDDANQPMFSHCKRYVMVYNGEVYNFREIQTRLKEKNPSFAARTQSDSEIILEAFAAFGPDFVHQLNGMFAIAIWDREQNSLYLYRDRLGIKPIYYYHLEGRLGFASELKVLEASFDQSLQVDYQAVNAFLHLGYIPAPLSIYRQIRKFPAGCMGVLAKGEFQIQPYWQAEEKIGASLMEDPLEARKQLTALIESSVRYRLVSDVPYGTFLSGGIDSSLVTAVAQSLHQQPINTFAIGFWDQKFNEADHARSVAKHLGTHHHELMVTEKDALHWMPLLNDIYDEPYADSSAIPTLLVSQMARKHVTMTLSGDGGDELFMGYGAYKWAQRLANPWVKLLSYPAAALLPFGPAKYRRAARLFENPAMKTLHSHIFSQEQYLFSRKEIAQYLNPEYYSDFPLRENLSVGARKLNAAEEQALFDLLYYLPDDLLVKVDRASMHFALETRVPLLDYRIVEWALNLHPSLKQRNSQAKWLLKEVLYQYVPAHLFQRPKRGFAIPLQKWLRKDLRSFAMDHLHPDAIRQTGLLNPKAVDALLKNFYNKDQHYLYNRIWQLLVLQRWFLSKTTP